MNGYKCNEEELNRIIAEIYAVKWDEFTDEQNKRIEKHFDRHFKRDYKHLNIEGHHSIICDVWEGLSCSCYDDKSTYETALRITNDKQYDVDEDLGELTEAMTYEEVQPFLDSLKKKNNKETDNNFNWTDLIDGENDD